MAKEKLLGDMAPPPIVLGLLAVFVAFEGAFWLAENSILPFDDLRWQVYLRMAFFDIFFDLIGDSSFLFYFIFFYLSKFHLEFHRT